MGQIRVETAGMWSYTQRPFCSCCSICNRLCFLRFRSFSAFYGMCVTKKITIDDCMGREAVSKASIFVLYHMVCWIMDKCCFYVEVVKMQNVNFRPVCQCQREQWVSVAFSISYPNSCNSVLFYNQISVVIDHCILFCLFFPLIISRFIIYYLI